MAIARKLRKILEDSFPPPDRIQLREDDGVIGIITSKRFRRMDTMQRQDLIHDILASNLTAPERQQVVIIVGVTPEEELANVEDDNE
jgi:hypothetical protein